MTLFPTEMAQRRSLAVPCGAPVLAISFLACVATGKQWKKNPSWLCPSPITPIIEAAQGWVM